MHKAFNILAERAARAFGSAWAFAAALAIVLLWALSGPAFHFNDTWQLTINTGTTIVTFLMVFLIQNSQNRDARTNHLKIDELLRAMEQARTSMVTCRICPSRSWTHWRLNFVGWDAAATRRSLAPRRRRQSPRLATRRHRTRRFWCRGSVPRPCRPSRRRRTRVASRAGAARPRRVSR